MLVAALGAIGLIWGTSSPKGALAARVPEATPTIKVTINVNASAQCYGTVGSTTDAADLPNGDINLDMGFLTGKPASTPRAGHTINVSGVFGLEINQKCTGLQLLSTQPTNPCTQAGQFSGTIDSNGIMVLSFSDAPSGFFLGPDVLDNCQMTFKILPYGKGTSANFIPIAPIQQAGGASGNCAPANTSLVLGCTAHNE
jgi:hypothetical protein